MAGTRWASLRSVEQAVIAGLIALVLLSPLALLSLWLSDFDAPLGAGVPVATKQRPDLPSPEHVVFQVHQALRWWAADHIELRSSPALLPVYVWDRRSRTCFAVQAGGYFALSQLCPLGAQEVPAGTGGGGAL